MTTPRVAYEACPRCGRETRYGTDCPGYRVDGRVMVCIGCGNADRWECVGKTCGWWYRYPEGHRSDVQQMGERPPWLDEWIARNFGGDR